MGGYMGKMAWIDLSTQKVRSTRFRRKSGEKYIGGTGLAAWALREAPFGSLDPLGPENVLIFAAGPLTGANVPLLDVMP